MPKKDQEGNIVIETINAGLRQVKIHPKVDGLWVPGFWVLLLLIVAKFMIPGGLGAGEELLGMLWGQITTIFGSGVDMGQTLWQAIFGGSAEAATIVPASPGIPVDPLPVFDAVTETVTKVTDNSSGDLVPNLAPIHVGIGD